jgi:hypothetical protein
MSNLPLLVRHMGNTRLSVGQSFEASRFRVIQGGETTVI